MSAVVTDVVMGKTTGNGHVAMYCSRYPLYGR